MNNNTIPDTSQLDVEIKLNFREFIHAIITPREDWSSTGYYGGTFIRESLADIIRTFPRYETFIHLEQIDGDEYYLWYLHNWNSTNRQTEVRRRNFEIAQRKRDENSNRITRSLENLIDLYPGLKKKKKIALDLLFTWLADPVTYHYRLQKVAHFEPNEEYEQALAQLQMDLEEFQMNAERKPITCNGVGV